MPWFVTLFWLCVLWYLTGSEYHSIHGGARSEDVQRPAVCERHREPHENSGRQTEDCLWKSTQPQPEEFSGTEAYPAQKKRLKTTKHIRCALSSHNAYTLPSPLPCLLQSLVIIIKICFRLSRARRTCRDFRRLFLHLCIGKGSISQWEKVKKYFFIFKSKNLRANVKLTWCWISMSKLPETPRKLCKSRTSEYTSGGCWSFKEGKLIFGRNHKNCPFIYM